MGNFEVKVSKAGKCYAAVDSWEPSKDQQYKEGVAQAKQAAEPQRSNPAPPDPFEDDIPFAQHDRGMFA